MKKTLLLIAASAALTAASASAQSINVTSNGVGIGTTTPRGLFDVGLGWGGGLVVSGANLDPNGD